MAAPRQGFKTNRNSCVLAGYHPLDILGLVWGFKPTELIELMVPFSCGLQLLTAGSFGPPAPAPSPPAFLKGKHQVDLIISWPSCEVSPGQERQGLGRPPRLHPPPKARRVWLTHFCEPHQASQIHGKDSGCFFRPSDPLDYACQACFPVGLCYKSQEHLFAGLPVSQPLPSELQPCCI